MKIISTIVLIFSFSYLVGQEQCNIEDLVYPEFERSVLSIWMGSNAETMDLGKKITHLKSVWETTKTQKPLYQSTSKDFLRFTTSIDQIIYLMDHSFSSGNYKRVNDFAYQMIMECRDLRDCLSEEVFSLNLLWNINDLYKEINVTINDPMFGLLEWQEFEEMVNQLKYYYSKYAQISDNDITSFYPEINLEDHVNKKIRFEECMHDFSSSLDSGYQENFKLPCNEMGKALIDLIGIYSH